MNERGVVGVVSGGSLGIFCIIGASTRLGWNGNELLIFALWYNRLVLGVLIGLADNLVVIKRDWNWIVRGAGLGLLVSAAYFLTSGATDWISFLAGILYGIIIEYVLKRFARKQAL